MEVIETTCEAEVVVEQGGGVTGILGGSGATGLLLVAGLLIPLLYLAIGAMIAYSKYEDDVIGLSTRPPGVRLRSPST